MKQLIDLFLEKKFFEAFQNDKTIKNRLKNKDFSLLFLFSSSFS
jgi:hypothetical protein